MAAKRQQVLWKSVWDIAERLEKSFGLTGTLSAGLVLFDKLNGDEQRELIAQVRDGKLEPPQTSEDDFRRRVIQVFEELEAYRKKKKPHRRAKPAKSG